MYCSPVLPTVHCAEQRSGFFGIAVLLAVHGGVAGLRAGDSPVGLACGISEQQGAGVEGTAQQIDISFIDPLEVSVGEYVRDVGESEFHPPGMANWRM